MEFFGGSKKDMEKQQQKPAGNSMRERGGDTSRTSSQGRKTASGGGKTDKRGNEQNKEIGNPVSAGSKSSRRSG